MNRIAILALCAGTLIAIVVVGCSPPSFIPRQSTFLAVDFTKYTAMGFLITPEKYGGDYESIGTVRYILTPSAKLVVTNQKKHADGSTEETKRWMVEQLPMTYALDSLYLMAHAMGADAIMNFSAVEEKKEYLHPTKPVTISGYNLSGYAIRRKK